MAAGVGKAAFRLRCDHLVAFNLIYPFLHWKLHVPASSFYSQSVAFV